MLIGFKGSAALANDLKDCARLMGLQYSALLRAVAEDCVKQVKRAYKSK